MRFVLTLAVTLSISLSALAQSARIRFIPPDPDSRTPVVARISGEWPDSALPRCAEVTRTDHTVVIDLGCIPTGASLPVVTPFSLEVVVGPLPAGRYTVEVRRPGAGSIPTRSLVQTTLIVQDGNAPFTVSPNTWYGPPPSTVILEGSALVCRDSNSCPQPIVRFGTQQATVVRMTGDRWEVEPPFGTGTVDVTVEQGSQTLRRVAAFHYADPTAFPPIEFFTPVLFPVFSSSQGALGSIWETEASIHNGNPHRLITTYGTLFNEGCRLCDPAPPLGVAEHSSAIAYASALGLVSDRGYTVYFPRDVARNLSFGLLVRDLSRQAEALGTEVPVVRENEWYDAPFSLLNVPTDPRFRVALRVYTRVQSTPVRVRIRPMDDDAVPVEALLVTTASGGEGPQHGAVVINNLLSVYPQLAIYRAVRIEVIPPDANTPTWAFASITNNSTQHVTVISPQ